jgi:hypothetical protein
MASSTVDNLWRQPMKFGVFEWIIELNTTFGQVMVGLDRLKSVPFFQRDLIQRASSGVEIARVYANREFFDNFEAIVDNAAEWAYKFQRDFDQKLKDQDDIYLELRDSQRRRKRNGLPPRVLILPNWDMSDEGHYDEEQSARRKSAGGRRHRRMNRNSSREAGPTPRESGRSIVPKRRGHHP